jgi:hypothetical protein
MKTLFIALLCTVIVLPVFSQDNTNNQKAFYLMKAEKYRRMRNTGATLTIGGTILTVVGIATIANASTTTTTTSSGTYTTSSGNLGAGVAAYLVGVCSTSAGVPLWIVGGINHGRYRDKYDKLILQANASPRHAGLALTYKF